MKNILFACGTEYHLLVSFILSTTTYLHRSKALLIHENPRTKRYIQALQQSGIWDAVYVINGSTVARYYQEDIHNILNDIEVLHFFSWGYIELNLLYTRCAERGVRIILTDEGVATYSPIRRYAGWLAQNPKQHFVVENFDLTKVDEIWLSDPAIFCEPRQWPIRQIPTQSFIEACKENSQLRDQFFAFLGLPGSFSFSADVIYFRQYFGLIGVLPPYVDSWIDEHIVDCFTGAHFFLKNHPSHANDLYRDAGNVTETNDLPWEVIVLLSLIDPAHKIILPRILISFTTSALPKSAMLGVSGIYIYLHKILERYTSVHDDTLDEVIEKLRDHYPDSKFFVPTDWDHLRSMLRDISEQEKIQFNVDQLPSATEEAIKIHEFYLTNWRNNRLLNDRLVTSQEELSDQQAQFAHQKQNLESIQALLAQREQEMVARDEIVTSLQSQLTQQEQQLFARAETVESLQSQLAQRDHHLRASQSKISESEQYQAVLKKQVSTLEQALSDAHDYQNQREIILQDLNSKLLEIYSSTAWKLIRMIWTIRLWLAPKDSRRERLAKSIFHYRFTPKPNQQVNQEQVAPSNGVQAVAPEAVEGANVVENGRHDGEIVPFAPSLLYEQLLSAARGEKGPDFVEFSENDLPSTELPAKLIAFYLPQFHPVTVNDIHWGKGFTEWTNVSKAVPQFDGHYQPHLPGELGFYDLRLPEVLRRQVELAKEYGIYGFCFHYYWFSGQRLLEGPLELFVSDPLIDFPFCVCWANENWTRRWDGHEDEVIVGQEHSLENDARFIRDLEPLLNHPNYIKVDGRPLIIVYRTSLLKDARKTAELWRAFCQEKGFGDPYLVAAQTFGFKDPRPIGFDAAVEFPPHGIDHRKITQEVKLFNQSYAGNVYHYVEMVEKSIEDSTLQQYRVIKTVSPAWDNEPRKPGRGDSFIYASPAQYQRWLTQCIIQEKNKHPSGNRFVFINAWNEWGEGAYLEPDRKYGYAYLAATRNALRTTGAMTFVNAHGPIEFISNHQNSKTAVILHLYYEDLFDEIKHYLKNVGDFDLYVSVPASFTKVDELIFSDYPDARVFRTENRGRDIAPFLSIYRVICEMKYDQVLKIHTKKSIHRGDGSFWRKDIYEKLMGSEQNVLAIKNEFKNNNEVGIIGPEQHVLDYSIYWGSNEQMTRALAKMVGIPFPKEPNFVFVAGSMFWVRPSVLTDLKVVPIDYCDFEGEPLPPDGTIAHAFERFLGLSVENKGYTILGVDENGNIVDPKKQGEKLYPFANPGR